jgi:hypothetical protein
MDTIRRDGNLTNRNQYNGSLISNTYFTYANETVNQIEIQKLNHKNFTQNLIIFILVSMVLFVLFGFGFLYFYRTMRNEKNGSRHELRYMNVQPIDPPIEGSVTGENQLFCFYSSI